MLLETHRLYLMNILTNAFIKLLAVKVKIKSCPYTGLDKPQEVGLPGFLITDT
jgi:hypothetical protein